MKKTTLFITLLFLGATTFAQNKTQNTPKVAGPNNDRIENRIKQNAPVSNADIEKGNKSTFVIVDGERIESLSYIQKCDPATVETIKILKGPNVENPEIKIIMLKTKK